MRPIYFLSLVILLFILSSRRKGGYDYGNFVNITVLNKQGNNLLADTITYNQKTINVYYLVNGQPELYYKPQYNHSKGYFLSKNQNGERNIRVLTDYNWDLKSAITLIQFGNLPMDTVRCQYYYRKHSVFFR